MFLTCSLRFLKMPPPWTGLNVDVSGCGGSLGSARFRCLCIPCMTQHFPFLINTNISRGRIQHLRSSISREMKAIQLMRITSSSVFKVHKASRTRDYTHTRHRTLGKLGWRPSERTDAGSSISDPASPERPISLYPLAARLRRKAARAQPITFTLGQGIVTLSRDRANDACGANAMPKSSESSAGTTDMVRLLT